MTTTKGTEFTTVETTLQYSAAREARHQHQWACPVSPICLGCRARLDWPVAELALNARPGVDSVISSLRAALSCADDFIESVVEDRELSVREATALDGLNAAMDRVQRLLARWAPDQPEIAA